MSDKLKQGVVVVPTFSDGEAPRGAKLNTIGSQLQRATSQLEKAVGDIHDESYPYHSTHTERLSIEWGRSRTSNTKITGALTRSLDIASLARLIGPASNLNPSMPMGTVSITETVPSGVYAFTLSYPVFGSTVTSTDTSLATRVLLSDLNASGEFFITNQTVHSFAATTGGTITYNTSPTAYAGGPVYQGATFNVIPDPQQAELGSGCTVAVSGSRFSVTLPICTHLPFNLTHTSTALGTSDALQNEQLYLPKVLVDNYVSGDTIPGGFVYLKNYTTGEVYKDAVYYYISSTEVELSGVDLTGAIADGDTFILFTVGTDITTTISDLRDKFFTHKHDGTFGEGRIKAEDIVCWTSVAGPNGPFYPSRIASNYAPQYLHRDGYQATETAGNSNNIMRGDLVLGAIAAVSGSHYTLTGATRKLAFGTLLGPYLEKDSGGDLNIVNSSGDVDIESTELRLEAQVRHTDVPAENGLPYYFENTGHQMSTISGHFVNGGGMVAAESLLAGPWNAAHQGTAADVWDRQSGAAVTNAWVVPRIWNFYYAEDNLQFSPIAADGSAATTWGLTDRFERTINLPSQLTGAGTASQYVLSVNIMVRKNGGTNWYSGTYSGFISGNQGAVGYKMNNTSITVIVGAQDSNNPFYWDDFTGESILDSPDPVGIDVKMYITTSSIGHVQTLARN